MKLATFLLMLDNYFRDVYSVKQARLDYCTNGFDSCSGRHKKMVKSSEQEASRSHPCAAALESAKSSLTDS